MGTTGSVDTRLIVLRGNSASGKSTTAQAIRDRYGYGLAIVGQDNLRRIVLREPDHLGCVTIGLIDLTTRYALDHGYHVVLEGILRVDHYGEMLLRLKQEHRGTSRFYYFDISFEETLRRHTTKPQTAEYGETEMRTWYRPGSVVSGLDEQCILEATPLDEAVDQIMKESGLSLSS